MVLGFKGGNGWDLDAESGVGGGGLVEQNAYERGGCEGVHNRLVTAFRIHELAHRSL